MNNRGYYNYRYRNMNILYYNNDPHGGKKSISETS